MNSYPLTPGALIWLETILQERFGLGFNLAQVNQALSLSLSGDDRGEIIFPKQLECFALARSNLPYTEWNAAAEGWQEVFDKPLPMPGVSDEVLSDFSHPLIELSEGKAIIHYDLLGLTYWMLNRIEEIGRTDLDSHGRFPAISSHAYKHDYLERPVVDEWLHILGQVIKKVWPTVRLKEHSFSMKVSHDVDNPSRYVFRDWKGVARACIGDIVKRGAFKKALLGPFIKVVGKNKIPSQDPYNTFDWLMDISEENNLTSAFYFICGGNDPHDADYKLEDIRIRELMQKIHNRGHEIGLHPSYQTYQTPHMISAQADLLRRVCKEEGIAQSEFGGRMHYLRWEHPTTLQAWEDAGMAYDSTLSYADRPGFRCGTCYEYPAYNPVTQKVLNLRIRPLIAMDCTIIEKRYMGLGYTQEALNKFLELKNKCKKISGSFTLLWHNSYFENKISSEIYKRAILDN